MLGAYDYRIRYRQGKASANADALSRLPLPVAGGGVRSSTASGGRTPHGISVDHTSLQFTDQSLDKLRSDTIQGDAEGTGGMA